MKYKYSDIELVITQLINGHEYLYFTADEGSFYEWQRGSQTINVKGEPNYNSQDLHCFSMSYHNQKPAVKQVKSCILLNLNES